MSPKLPSSPSLRAETPPYLRVALAALLSADCGTPNNPEETGTQGAEAITDTSGGGSSSTTYQAPTPEPENSSSTGPSPSTGEIPNEATTGSSTSGSTTDGSSTSSTTEQGESESTTTAPAVCGNGQIEVGEACDDGVNDGSYNGCEPGCTEKGPHCGDGKPQKPEQCDDGINDGSYDGCEPGCEESGPYCGDGKVQENEVCDLGSENNNDYECTEQCDKAPEWCGDNEIQVNQGEKCEGAEGIADLKCATKQCTYDFSGLQQIYCFGPASPDGIDGCGQGDADIVCQLRHNTPNVQAESFSPSNSPLDGQPLIGGKFPDDISINLGPIPQAGLYGNVFYVPTDAAKAHKLKYGLQQEGWITKVYCEGK